MAKIPVSRALFSIRGLFGVVSGERETSCVLCACQEIVNFIFFLHSTTLYVGERIRATQAEQVSNRSFLPCEWGYVCLDVLARPKRLLAPLYSTKYLCDPSITQHYTKGAHSAFPFCCRKASEKTRGIKTRTKHRWRNFCVSCDYLFLISKATVWHVVAAQKYIILWQIATFSTKLAPGELRWTTVLSYARRNLTECRTEPSRATLRGFQKVTGSKAKERKKKKKKKWTKATTCARSLLADLIIFWNYHYK